MLSIDVILNSTLMSNRMSGNWTLISTYENSLRLSSPFRSSRLSFGSETLQPETSTSLRLDSHSTDGDQHGSSQERMSIVSSSLFAPMTCSCARVRPKTCPPCASRDCMTTWAMLLAQRDIWLTCARVFTARRNLQSCLRESAAIRRCLHRTVTCCTVISHQSNLKLKLQILIND